MASIILSDDYRTRTSRNTIVKSKPDYLAAHNINIAREVLRNPAVNTDVTALHVPALANLNHLRQTQLNPPPTSLIKRASRGTQNQSSNAPTFDLYRKRTREPLKRRSRQRLDNHLGTYNRNYYVSPVAQIRRRPPLFLLLAAADEMPQCRHVWRYATKTLRQRRRDCMQMVEQEGQKTDGPKRAGIFRESGESTEKPVHPVTGLN